MDASAGETRRNRSLKTEGGSRVVKKRLAGVSLAELNCLLNVDFFGVSSLENAADSSIADPT